jgi:ubiquinone/menaquinone biosynthesis C-methylase UbiE
VAGRCLEHTDIYTVLDVGSGSGLFTEAFSKQGCRVTGIDINPDMLTAARQFVPEVPFQLGQMENLPYRDRSFDLVFMGFVLHETNSPVPALREARRISRIRTAVLEWPFIEEEQGPPLAHRLSPGRIREIAAAAGFEEIVHHALQHTELWFFKSA